MNLRTKLFWCLDKLMSAPVSKHHEEIGSFINKKDEARKENDIRNHFLRIINPTPFSSIVFYILTDSSKRTEAFHVVWKSIIYDIRLNFLLIKFNDKTRIRLAKIGFTDIPFKLYHG